MRHPACSRIVGVAVFLAVAATVEATPFLPDDIRVGAGITGSFAFPVTNGPPDQDPSPEIGRYLLPEVTAFMRVSAGGSEFSTRQSGFFVQVNDQSVDADFIQLGGSGNEKTFAPFLTGFARQNPSLEPRGEIVMNFRFPVTYLSDDGFPTSIDPLATVPHPGGLTSSIFGQVEGVSTQTPTSGIREWAFFFDIDPLSLNVVLNAGVLSSNFSGTIYGVDDSAVIGPPGEPIPEPSTMILVMTGLLVLRKMASRSDS